MVEVDEALSGVVGGDLQVVPVTELRLHPRNARRGDLTVIAESLRVHGQFKPLVVRRDGMVVLAGNHTLRAMRELGFERASAFVIDVNEKQAEQILLVDNRSSDLAGYDTEALVELLKGLVDLSGTGYSEGDLDGLLDELAAAEPVEDDQVPPLPAVAVTEPGDLFTLGCHRLLCADATDPDSYARLLQGERADVLWTDPPYGVGYRGKTAARLTIANDADAGLEPLLRAAFAAIDGVLSPGAPLYVARPSGRQGLVFLRAFTASGWVLRQELVWVKDAMVLGRSDFHYRHEPLIYGFRPAEGCLGRGGRNWYGGNRQTSVFELARPRSSQEHPTMKPPELVAACLRNSTRRGGIVLDPFCGSGSTLVACERLGRSARLLEIEPSYCDVIIERYERLTGNEAVRSGAG